MKAPGVEFVKPPQIGVRRRWIRTEFARRFARTDACLRLPALDEIGDMPLAMQTRLLRVLAEREVLPLGAEQAVPVDLQAICATQRDLMALVQAGQFRLDLCYRLNGLVLSLPALRDRLDKVDLILQYLGCVRVDRSRQ